jgi:hypothetical protein
VVWYDATSYLYDVTVVGTAYTSVVQPGQDSAAYRPTVGSDTVLVTSVLGKDFRMTVTGTGPTSSPSPIPVPSASLPSLGGGGVGGGGTPGGGGTGGGGTGGTGGSSSPTSGSLPASHRAAQAAAPAHAGVAGFGLRRAQAQFSLAGSWLDPSLIAGLPGFPTGLLLPGLAVTSGGVPLGSSPLIAPGGSGTSASGSSSATLRLAGNGSSSISRPLQVGVPAAVAALTVGGLAMLLTRLLMGGRSRS